LHRIYPATPEVSCLESSKTFPLIILFWLTSLV
jgi:hypothetical protein